MRQPLIGITVDHSTESGRFQVAVAYVDAVSRAGGLSVLLPCVPDLAGAYAARCDGLVLTGGVDPRTEAFGEPTDPRARPMDPRRQTFELALLAAAETMPASCVLGICLGMQLMGLRAGARLDQYLPDACPGAAIHEGLSRHAVRLHVRDSVISADPSTAPTVLSNHRQALADPGRLRLVATAADGVIEAIDDPARRFYAGVQWHPEREAEATSLSQGLFDRLVQAAAGAT